MSEYFESSFFSKYQCGFRKGFSAQHCLVSMFEKWKSATDNKKSLGARLQICQRRLIVSHMDF